MTYYGSWKSIQGAYPTRQVRWQSPPNLVDRFQNGDSSLTARVCDHPPGTLVPRTMEDGFSCFVCGENFKDKKNDAPSTIAVRVVGEAILPAANAMLR